MNGSLVQTHATTVVATGLIATFGLSTLGASSARAQGFTPKSDERLSTATIRAGSEANAGGGQTLRIGIEQCKDLAEDDDATFRFEFDRQIQVDQNADADAAIFEFDAADGPSGSCSKDVPDDACSGVESSNDDVTVTEGNQVFEVQLPFELLQTFDDNTSEPCTPSGSNSNDTSQSLEPPPPTPPQNTGADAGMSMDAGTSDLGIAEDTGEGREMEPDAGMSSDIGDQTDPVRDTGTSTSNGEGTSDEFDRIYVLRAFLQEPNQTSVVGGTQQGRQFRVDGVVWLDRTRPGAVQGISEALASENTLAVRFTPPSNEDDVENYHVFISNDPIDTSQSADELVEADGIERRIVTSLEDQDGAKNGQVDIDRTAGNTVYVAMATRDEAENFSSVRSLDQEIDVKESRDFWERYLNAGGAETGGCGCSSSGTPPVEGWLFVALLGALWGRRRWSDRT
jgi:MYXO-CTERM domain-containing protein